MAGLFYIPAAERARFVAELNAELARIEREATEVYRGWITATFHRLTMETPQWTGNAVSNWNVSLNSPDTSVRFSLKRADEDGRGAPGAKGDTRAVMLAVRRASATISSIPLDSKVPVYFANSSENLDGKSYIQYLEDNPNNFLREVNEPGQMVERAANTASSLGNLSLAQQTALRALKPGQLYNLGVGI